MDEELGFLDLKNRTCTLAFDQVEKLQKLVDETTTKRIPQDRIEGLIVEFALKAVTEACSNCGLKRSINEALNSGDGSYRP